MQPKATFLIILAIYLLGFFSHALYLRQTVYGDGVFYYSWLRSMVIDGDFGFGNDYDHFKLSQPETASGLPRNKYTIGPAFLWLPPFVSVHNLIGGTGFELPYQLVIGLSSLLYAYLGILLLFRLLQKYFGQKVSLLAILSLALATNLWSYGSLDTVNSHSLSFFGASLFLTLLYGSGRTSWLLVGLSLGLMVSIRLQDALYSLLLLQYLRRESFFKVGIWTLVGFFPQLLAWRLTEGSWLTIPYLRGGEGFNFGGSQLLSVLFSPKNGTLLWTPILLLGFVGFFTSAAKRVPHRYFFLAVTFLAIYLVGSWSAWWQGASYSGRMFVSILPLLAFGLAAFYTSLHQKKLTQQSILLSIVMPLAAINGLLMIFFLLWQP